MSSDFTPGRMRGGPGGRMAGAGGPFGGGGFGGVGSGMGLMGLGLLSGPILDMLKPIFDKFGIEVSQLAAILLTLGTLRYLYSTILSFSYLLAPFRTYATLRSTDELYPIVSSFLGTKIGESRHFEAQCLPGDKSRRSRRRPMMVNMAQMDGEEDGEATDESSDDSEREEDVAGGGGEKGERKIFKPKRVQKQANRLQFAPAHGTHYFFYRRHLVTVALSRETNGPYGQGFTDILTLSTLSLNRSSTILRTLIQEAYDKAQSKHHQKTMIYRAASGGMSNGMVFHGNSNWQAAPPRPSRPIDSVAMDTKDRDLVIRDIDEYLSIRTARYYARRGIPYRRGYLFSGNPGTGKTSLSFALAGLFNLPLFVFDLTGNNMNDSGLLNYFSGLPKKAIVLIEDVDVALPGGQAQDRSMQGAMASGYLQQQRKAKERRRAQRLAMQERLEKMESALKASSSSTSETGVSTSAAAAETGVTPSVNGVAPTKADTDANGTLPTPEVASKTDATSQASSLPSPAATKRVTPVVQFVDDESDDDDVSMPMMSMNGMRFGGPQRAGVTLSGLLNAIDGVSASEQRILIMTSNHPERLDPALIRPGRVDVHIRFSLATPSIAKAVFESIYQDDESPTSRRKRRWTDQDVKEWSQLFASQIPLDTISPAELQGYLLMHKKQPKVAAEGVGRWIADMRKEKERDMETLLAGK